MKVKQQYLEVSKDVLDLYLCELHECHRLLDKAGIPKDNYGEPLSIAQRVALIVEQHAHATH